MIHNRDLYSEKANKYKNKINNIAKFDDDTKNYVIEIVRKNVDIYNSFSDNNPHLIRSDYNGTFLILQFGDTWLKLKPTEDYYLEENNILQEITMSDMIDLMKTNNINQSVVNFTDERFHILIYMNVILGYLYSSKEVSDRLNLKDVETINPCTRAIVKITLSTIKKMKNEGLL